MPEGAESYKDKETLERLYWGEGMSMVEIGERFGVDQSSVAYWMDELNVESRSLSEAQANRTDRGEGTVPEIRLSMRNGYATADCRGEYVYIHRLLAVSEYGFDAVKDKEVHHKNGVRNDNRPSNIELMGSSEHRKHHWEAGDYDDVVG